jgi:hypothetical protein
MVHSATHLKGRTLHARDGVIGHVTDLYFDDETWAVRYLVVDTDDKLKAHTVLISPGVAGTADWQLPEIPVDLTTDEIRRSPDIDADKPPTREHELLLEQYYGWAAYTGSLFAEPIMPMPVLIPAIPPTDQERFKDDGKPARHSENAHLRSVNDTVGYRVRASDGEVGHVDNFLVDDETWRIQYFVIDTRNWLPGRKVLVAPDWVRDVDWVAQKVHADLTRDAVRASPPYDPSIPWRADYASELSTHYGRAKQEAHAPSG